MNIREKLLTLYKYIEENRIPQSGLKTIPIISDLIEELASKADVDGLLQLVAQQSSNNQNDILEKIDYIISEEGNKKPLILVIGGGNSEEILKLESELVIGSKHKVETESLFGGSGVNYLMRLLTFGYDVFPILPIGKDTSGRNIRKIILKTARSNNSSKRVIEFIGRKDDNRFYDPYIKTPNTTVVVENSRRSIFTEKMKNGQNFINFVKKRIEDTNKFTFTVPSAVMIGHIYSDSKEISKENAGNVTKYIIATFKNRSLIFANLGSSQLSLGLDFWKKDLLDIDFFQVNLDEAKKFFCGEKGEALKLTEIIKLIRSININVVITLDKFGAIGIHKEKKDAVCIAWPVLDANEVVDPTGAGDAFAAGLVAYMVKAPNMDAISFRDAILNARIWAAYACSTYGGANQCPTARQLEEYKQTITLSSNKSAEITDQDYTSEILTLLDIAFQ